MTRRHARIVVTTAAIAVALASLATAVLPAAPGSSLPIASFTQNFDGVTPPALPADWIATNAQGAAPNWATVNNFSDTAPNAAFANDPDFVTDRYLDTPAFVPVGPLPRVKFRHKFDFEGQIPPGTIGFDGGVLEISIGGGAFADILTAGGSFVIGGYTHTISASFGSPILNRQAWSGDSQGFVTTVARLPAAAVGQSVTLRFRVATDMADFDGGWWIDTVTVVRNTQRIDFDGDAISDFTVVRAVSGAWVFYTLNNSGFTAIPWGLTSRDAWSFTGDYDADGRSDHVSAGDSPFTFFIRLSASGALFSMPFGGTPDTPLVPGDYDGDLTTDIAVWRPTTGVWWVRRSSTGTVSGQAFGLQGDRVFPSDFDGDLVSDLTVARNESGNLVYYIQQSTAGFAAVQWGFSSDRSIAGDFDGDGKADVAIARVVNGAWNFYVRRSSDGALAGQVWGFLTDHLAPGDYDGDGKTDFAVWRPTEGTFYVLRSTNGALMAQPFGQFGDYVLARFPWSN